jgi:hypothetical protein
MHGHKVAGSAGDIAVSARGALNRITCEAAYYGRRLTGPACGHSAGQQTPGGDAIPSHRLRQLSLA